MKYLIFNLKANKTLTEIMNYEEKLQNLKPKDNLKILIAPTSIYFSLLKGEKYSLCAQDVSDKEMGAYTGEITAEQISSLKVKYTIIGHSERRNIFTENELTIVKKIKNALKANMKVIYCVGETKEEYLRKKTYVVLEKQLARILNEFNHEEIKNIIIAYEPVWSIGKGKLPEKKEVEDISLFIKKIMKEYYEVNTSVLYGGSIDDKTIKDYKDIKSIDGFLIGGASKDADKVVKIVNNY